MALITCPGCKKEISDELDICVHCNYPLHGIDCPKCNKKIHQYSETCPHCDYNIYGVTCPECGKRFGRRHYQCPHCGSKKCYDTYHHTEHWGLSASRWCRQCALARPIEKENWPTLKVFPYEICPEVTEVRKDVKGKTVQLEFGWYCTRFNHLCLKKRTGSGRAESLPCVCFQMLSAEAMDERYQALKALIKTDEADKKKGGCYVATAVYGSYDCPQVWTLRRYRDDTLAAHWYGRIFIKIYYAISPILVRWFGKTKWFTKLWRGKLDHMVQALNAQGVESTPYQDKEW